jgi:hypothetical protein
MPSRSKGLATQHDVGQLRGGTHEEIRVHVEVERGERLAAAADVRVRHEEVGAEAHHAAHGVGPLLEHCGVDLVGGHPFPARGPDRPLGQAEASIALRRPFHREGWIYEEKYDGWRMVAYKDGTASSDSSAGRVRITRGGLRSLAPVALGGGVGEWQITS